MTKQWQSAFTDNVFHHCLQGSFALLLIMIRLFFHYVRSEKQINVANEQRYQTRPMPGDEFLTSASQFKMSELSGV